MAERAKITVRGIVQGVGFRPYVFSLADELNLKGFVTNTSEGVSIDIEGERLHDFIERLPVRVPDLSKIVEINVESLPVLGYTDFRITGSIDQGAFTLLSPDVSVCDDCLRELRDSNDRRYLYPFINCTNCGPRFSITRSVPYDRPNTTMAVFEMCSRCRQEYDDPRDRRFHAQPNACPVCGPRVELRVKSETWSDGKGEDPLARTVHLLKSGAIVAVKGLGGFHIACDATSDDAVRRLRARKRRSNKPFALMAPDIRAVEMSCEVSDAERSLLISRARPIVLLRKRSDLQSPVSEAVSPHCRYLGYMLPYTPLHYLLFSYPQEEGTELTTLVMTSGNMTEEPVARDDAEAMEKLSGMVDAFLLHNREIFMRVDDSVVRTVGEDANGGPRETLFIRRSRGYAPDPLDLRFEGPEVLGCGADLKNTFTVTKGRFAIPSQHIGDMENYETLKFFEESLENLKSVYRVKPVALAYDLHPNYLSSRWALQQQIRRIGIQHHYAHIGSVMAEHGLRERVIGVALDGTGYGTDGNLWGGEFLVADISGFERAGHFKYLPLPGGERAVREPWRTAVSYVRDAAGERAFRYLEAIGFISRHSEEHVAKLAKVLTLKEYSPLSSGAGRLFDAVSAILGLCDLNTFEGEAAMALESLVSHGIDDEYPFRLLRGESRITVVDFSGTITAILDDVIRGVAPHVIATKFHNTVCSATATTTRETADIHKLNRVALSGGSFQNLYLLERVSRMLRQSGMEVFVNSKVPCNDAGISLGQAYIYRERLRTANQ